MPVKIKRILLLTPDTKEAPIMTDTSRIKEIPENAMSEAQKKVFADLVAGRGKLLAPYKIWIHSPKFAAAMEIGRAHV